MDPTQSNGEGLTPADKRLALQSAVARALTKATTVGDATRRVLESIGGTLGWRLGALWEVDSDHRVIRCVETWHAPGADQQAGPFEAASMEVEFASGVGLPGRVWADDAPAWVRDVTVDSNFPRARAAAECGVHGAFAFPIRSSHGIIGAVEFFTEEVAEPDQYLLDLMATIGHQLGQQIERTRAEEAVRASEARKSAMLEASLDCIVSMDHRGRVIEFNSAAEETFGYSAEEAMGCEMAELIIPPSLRDAHREGLRNYLETGEGPVLDQRLEITGMRSDGTEFPVELTIARIKLDGPPTFTGFIRDISERKKREEFDSFLAEAGALLGASLEVNETLRSVTSLAVPAIADWCTIDVLGDDGQIHRVAAAHTDPEKTKIAYDLAHRWPARLDDAVGFGRVIRTGEPEFYPELPGGVMDPAMRNSEYRQILRSLGLRSMVMVPMRTPGGEVLGGLALVTGDESGRDFDEQDVVLALEIGRRCAMAIDNARLYRERSEVAHTLQQSLLPPRLPAIPGVAVEARFRPAGEGVEVGGDFYDVFPIDEQAWAVTIGDVCGKGPEAAALTALMRYTIRAVTMHERRPDRVLALLNEAILRDRTDDRFCSAAFAVVEGGDGFLQVELACGGHPLPLVARRGGGVDPVGRGGLLLGLWDDAELVSETIDLMPGDAMLFYTDGVTDAHAPERILDQAALSQLVAGAAGNGAAAIAERIEEAVVEQAADPRDDIALLVLGVEAPAALSGERIDGFELTLESRPQAAAAARAAVSRLTGKLHASVVDDLKVLITELVTNSCRHAEGALLEVECGIGDGVVTISVRDGGHGFEPPEPARAPVLVPGESELELDESGRGLFIVDALAHRWGVDSSSGTRVWAELDLPSAGAA